MDGIDPDVLLEWLQTGIGDERDLQLMALEQLCMLLLMSDNIDRCFESCPPRTFLPALCKIFLDETATENVLEVTARAITYYLDVSNECTRRITQVEGAVKAICNRLAAAEMTDRASKDLAEQCVKLLEHVCQRETLAVYDAGGLNAMLTLVRSHGHNVHKDTMHSAMSVVTRLCGKMEPNDDGLPQCAESLGALLGHDDTKVSEAALRCFAALTDRFIRKMMDPAELATHSNLVDHLLSTLAKSADGQSANFISIVLSLLSNLCRGSVAVTEQVLSSAHLITAIRMVLTNKDDRCVTDGLRLADLLIVLLCEGRSALPHVVAVSGECGQVGQSAERAHRQLIDAIRQKDLSALVDAVENGGVDVNFTDDVGQTLCNWASAFGSLEMVQYLCDKGCDVNKGHKSSSLHYAACFGRSDIVKVLLQRGANPDLRDEDGKTALDKARERSDEDHAQVAQILESPTVYMHSKSDEGTKTKIPAVERKTSTTELLDKELASRVLQQLLPIFCEIFMKSLSANVRRTSLSLLRKIVENLPPVSASTDGSEPSPSETGMPIGAEGLMSVVVSVLDQEEDHEGQEQVLLILFSLLRSDPAVWVAELVRLGVFERVEAMAKEPPQGLDENFDEEEASHDFNARNSSAMSRSTTSTPSVAMEVDTISLPAASPVVNEAEAERADMLNITLDTDEMSTTETPPPTLEVLSAPSASSAASSLVALVTNAVTSSLPSSSTPKEEKKSKQILMTGTPYRWKEWRLARGDDSLFVWNDLLVLEFSFTSNGWFRYMMEDEVHLMFANGLLDTNNDNKVNQRKAFVTRWRRAKAQWTEEIIPLNMLSVPCMNKKLEVPQWELWSGRSNELSIKSLKTDSQLIVKDELGAFSYGQLDKSKVRQMPEHPLPQEFHTGWSAHGNSPRRVKFRAEIQRQKVQEHAWELWNTHLKEARARPREALIQLQKASETVLEHVQKASLQHGAMQMGKHFKQERIEHMQELLAALNIVRDSVNDDRRLSTFEFSVSGIVPALHALLSLAERLPHSYPAKMFREAFTKENGLSSLVQKMVAVLESNEKFPQYLYDTPGGSSLGLQLLQRKLRLKLEYGCPKAEDSRQLLDKNGKVVKTEALVTVGQLKSFILKMVAKQWFDRERQNFSFVKILNEKKKNGETVKLIYTSDFDEEGLIYWLGTNGRTTSEWTNPASVNVSKVICSDHRQPFGKPEDVLSRDVNPINCHTTDDKNSNFTIDLGVQLYPTAYSLRHARGYGRSALRNWLLQGSKDKLVWEVLVAHSDDTSLGEPGSTATWPIEDDRNKGPFRYIRIAQNGKNSSGQTHYLSMSGFEIYGEVVDTCLDGFEVAKKEDEKQKGSRIPQASSSASTPIVTNRKDLDEKSIAATIAKLPQGTNNNRLRSGMSPDTLTILHNRFKLRMARHNRDLGDIRGARVVRGPDWRWDDQDGVAGSIGRVVNLVENGWVDVSWENGHVNSYRFGAEGRFDVIRQDDQQRPTSSVPSNVLEGLRARSKGLMAKSREARDSPFASFTGFAPFSVKNRKTGANTPLSRFAKATTSTSAGTSSTPSSSNIGKKSMSTTNLVDERDRGKSGPSVASTGQAASAESLQHQTPSLENLLERANTHAFGRIAETGEGTETPEPGRDTPVAMESVEDSNPSISSSHADISVCSSQSSVVEASAEAPAVASVAGGQSDASMLNALSVSTPNLAARQRQPSTETFEMDKTVEEQDEEAEDEDEDEEEDDESTTDKEFAALMADALDSNASSRNLLTNLLAGLDPDSEDSLVLLRGSRDSEDSAPTPTTSTSSKPPKKDKTTLKQRLGSYAEVLKGLLQTVVDPNSSSLEVDDLLDEDEYYEDEEGNEDDLDDELTSLGVPPEALTSMFGGARTDYKFSWKQLSAIMGSARLREVRGVADRTRHWDDGLTIRNQCLSLIPAFDPRPGRTNVNQTQEVELPPVVSDFQGRNTEFGDEPTLRLLLRGPNMTGVDNVTIELASDNECVFRYVQDLINMIDWGAKGERNRRVWEPTYTIIYEDAALAPITEFKPVPCELASVPHSVNECLDVIGLLANTAEKMPDAQINPQVFISDKLTLKLSQELADALVVATGALPKWCDRLIYSYPCLFSMETRTIYMAATAFGVSRSVIWLQNRRDAAIERMRGNVQGSASSASRSDRYQEFRLGRLKHERVKITRCEEVLLEQAIRLMKFHAERKAVLEIEYTGEEGTGLGPTLEFYALVAAELQRKALAIWLCDDMDEHQLKMEEKELDLGEGKKPPGFYVRRAGGLFPAPLPPHTEEVRRATDMFRCLGIFLAKVLQDGRLVDLPLARPFLKMVVSPNLSDTEHPTLERVLSLDDFEEVHPVKAGFLKELRALAQRKRAIENDPALDRDAKRRKIDELKLCIHGTRCRVEDLALNFTVNPPSSVFEYEEMELVEGGADMDVTMDNVEIYVQKCADFYLNSGIIEQMKAFRDGFDRVFPLKALRTYNPDEVQRLVSGEQCPEWTREDVMKYTEPKLGYTKDSPGFLRFVDVMVGLNPQERKNFLQFATGCSSLPPGGLANLHPHLTVVRKVESGDGSYPSVNTCVHYLKLPEYSSAEILRERLLTAVNEKGFHLN